MQQPWLDKKMQTKKTKNNMQLSTRFFCDKFNFNCM